MQRDTHTFLVSSDASIGDALAPLLARYDIRLQTFTDPVDFVSMWSEEHMTDGCLLVDVERTGRAGWRMVRQLREQGFALPVIIISDVCDHALRQQAQQCGATDVIETRLIGMFVEQRLLELMDGAARAEFEPSMVLRDGTQVTFRVMRPEDADIEQAFVRGLSKATRRLRFFSALNELPPSLLHPFTHPDYPASYALIATIEQSGVEQIISVARYNTTQQDGVVEFAIVVADKWQRFGVANRLLRGLIAAAAIAGYDRLEGIVLRENRPMLQFANELGFAGPYGTDDPDVVRVVKALRIQRRVSQ